MEENTHVGDGLSERPDAATEKKLLYWGKRIEAAEEINKDLRKRYETNRKYVRGKAHDDGKPGLVRTNLTYSTIATLTPHIYAKDPDVVVSPVEHVSPSGYGAVKRFAKTAELALKRKVIVEGRMKKRLKSNIRSIFTTGLGWMKMLYQSDIIYDPLTSSRIQTLQDNLREIDVLSAKLKRRQDIDKAEETKFDLMRQIQAVQGEKEPRNWKGFVIDRVLSEDILILDRSITDFEDYMYADAIAHGIWMADDAYESTFGYKPHGSSYSPEGLPELLKKDSDKRSVGYKRVWEIWSLKDYTVYTFTQGEKRWARPPYCPENLPHRFYPFYCGGFFPVDGEWQPLDLVSLLKELQDEYNKTRTTYAEHREDSIPVRVVRQGGSLTDDDIQRIQNRESGDIIIVNGNGRDNPIGNDMGHLPNIPLQPEMYDVTQIRADMDIVSGTPDASRGNLTEAKTATEASILQEGLSSRSGDMRDNVEDLLSEMLSDALQIMLQTMTVDEIVEIAGPGAVWPSLSRDQVFGLVTVSVRGGSTARPNKDREKQQWIELLPVLREFVMTVGEVIAQGNTQLATTMIQLLKETLTRFDERLDIQSIMPFASQDGSGLDQNQVNAASQMQQLQQGMQQMQEYIGQLEQQLQEAQGQVQNKQADLEQRGQQAEAEGQRDLTKHEMTLENQKEIEAAKIEAQLDQSEEQDFQRMSAEIRQRKGANQEQQQA